MAPIKQSIIGCHERGSVNQRSGDNESVGRIVMQTGKVERAHCDITIERQLVHAGREQSVPRPRG